MLLDGGDGKGGGGRGSSGGGERLCLRYIQPGEIKKLRELVEKRSDIVD